EDGQHQQLPGIPDGTDAEVQFGNNAFFPSSVGNGKLIKVRRITAVKVPQELIYRVPGSIRRGRALQRRIGIHLQLPAPGLRPGSLREAEQKNDEGKTHIVSGSKDTIS